MLFLKNAKIMTVAKENFEKGNILIENGKIKEIGVDVVAPLDAKVIDLEGKIIYPGFIDAHTHLGMWEDSIGFEGEDGNEMTDPVTPELRSIDAINPMDKTFKEALEGGITTVASGPGSANVIGGTFSAIKTYGKRIDNMIVKNEIGMKIAFGENPKSVYGKDDKAPQTRMAIASTLRDTLFKAKNYYEELKAYNENKEENDKPEFDMKYEALIPVFEKKIPLKAHAHRADDIFSAIRIAKEFDLDLTLDHCTEGYLIKEELKEENYPVIVGPNLSDRSKFELKNLDFKNPGELAKEGLLVAIMTDHPVIPVQYLPLCASLAIKSGMKEEDALKAITINPAKILKLDNRVGSLEVGKDADIVVLDGNVFEIQSKVCMTIIDGKILYNLDENK